LASKSEKKKTKLMKKQECLGGQCFSFAKSLSSLQIIFLIILHLNSKSGVFWGEAVRVYDLALKTYGNLILVS
jgi:hypothetical protein